MGWLNYWKEIGLLLLTLVGGGYVAKLKYDKQKAENKLAKAEIDIATTRTKIVQKTAKITAGVKKIETDEEVASLKALNKIKKEAREEVIKTTIADEEYRVADVETKKFIRTNKNAITDTI